MTPPPDQVIANIREENAALRKIIHECANALPNGAYCSPECSIGFMAEVPKEIRLVTIEMRERAEAAEAERDALRKGLEPFSKIAGEMFARNWNAKQIVVALDTPEESHRVTAGDFFRARTLLSGDNHENHG